MRLVGACFNIQKAHQTKVDGPDPLTLGLKDLEHLPMWATSDFSVVLRMWDKVVQLTSSDFSLWGQFLPSFAREFQQQGPGLSD
jgi:hypothetical protein